MSDVELKVSSTKVEKLTTAIDGLVSGLEKLEKEEKKATETGETLNNQHKTHQATLDKSSIALKKSADMLELETSGLAKSSQAYAVKKAAILTNEQAARKGIDTDSKAYDLLKRDITMREKNIAKLKKHTEAQKAKEKSAKASAAETKKMGKGMELFTSQLDGATKQVQLIDGPLGGVASRMTALSSILKSGVGSIAALSIGVGLFFHQLAGGIATATDAEVSMRTLEAQIDATGNAAGLTANQMDDLSRALAFATLDNSQGVRELVSTMLTFESVQGRAFKSAIELSEDMGIALKMNPVSAARLLGKVLENPIDNYKQLKRSGIEFTKTEKEAMEQYQLSGRIYEAQAVIIERLEGRFKGVARAQADTLAGDIDTFGQKWEEYWEMMGEKGLPILRAMTQGAISFMDSLPFAESEAVFLGWKNSLEGSVGSVEEVNVQIQKVIENQRKATEEQEAHNKVLEEAGDAWFKNRGSQANVEESARLNRQNELLKQQLAWLLEIEKLQVARVAKGAMLNEEQEKAVEGYERSVEQQERLTKAFIQTGDTRSKLYRETKVQIDTEIALKKLGIRLDNEAGKEAAATIRESIENLSELTNARVVHNAALQKQKALHAKQEGLQKELQLMELVESGVRKNSEEYILAAAAIDARNQAQRAGFEAGSKEYEMILRETEALGLLQAELQRAADLKAAGVQINMFGNEESTDTQGASSEKMLEEMDFIRNLKLENEELTEQKIREIREKYAEMDRARLEEQGITEDSEGNQVMLDSEEAVFMERDAKLKELKQLQQDGFIESETIYLERRNQITQEYDEKAMETRKNLWEKSAEHKRNVNQMELAGNIKAGIDNLAATKKNNKALAVMSKAASIYKAGVSLVDGLSAANKEDFPMNVALYAKAFVQGTALVQQASSLSAPSYAFGGVDIEGAGTGRSDSIQANIAKGESVITAPATARHRQTLKRMNAGLPIGNSGGGGNNFSMAINVAGDASEQTVGLIEERLLNFEDRVAQISSQVSTSSIQEENEIGGILNPI